ncbi:hypothetical protein GOP47_0007332 [Adiantum capillus-veneris]|uniref:Uncharacterized protein n=1 Tax=Adiantum capillus-veneris TaxID=13818 RepID=A0A9D4V1D2_ADICA|nr:hypothetical protein GOP47_0007332 [Adiantum capillus-veneris]
MDAYEVTRRVYSRVQALEPELASKIMGYLLLQDQGEQEMLKLAFAPDLQLQAVMNKAKQQLGLSLSHVATTVGVAPTIQSQVAAPPYRVPGLFSSITSASSPSPLLLPPDPFPYYGEDSLQPSNSAPVTPLHHQQHHHHHPHYSNGFDDAYPPPPDVISNLLVDKFHAEAGPNFFSRPLSVTARRPSSLSDFPLSPDSTCLSPAWKPCLYYSRGYCKHGSNCRFLHAHHTLRSDPGSPSSVSSNGQRDYRIDDMVVPGSLERLEMELEELLRGRRAPVSIASLPQLYYEKFGRTLQAEGYLTESQRHGKAGFSLTKLLARLKNTVTLIDRPHGQHAVVLAEDAMRFSVYRSERDDLCTVNPGSRQIYLTFPAESTFSEEDVSAYFRGYGPVQDVRIPFQQKRMFGFVTFVYPETVKAILAKGNPHHICGARVLVKPYKEKSKHSENRRLVERDHSRFFPSRSFDGREFPFSPGAQFFDDHDLLRRQINEQALEMERRRFADFQFSESPRMYVQTGTPVLEPARGHFGLGSNGLAMSHDLAKGADDLNNIQVPSSLGYILDVLDNDPSENEQPNEKIEPAEQSHGNNEHNLPDSPFASPKGEQPQSGTSSALEVPINFNADVQSLFPAELLSSTSSFEDDKDLICRICRGPFADPIRLDCNHMFCVDCILKVIRVSKDECPSCQQHIGSQVVRLLESRGLPVIDPSLTKPRVAAISNQKISSW